VTRVLTKAEYQEIVNSGCDYCDCCGGLYEVEGLDDNPAMMPDPDNPMILLNGFTVCYDCSRHCEQGPCQPDYLVEVREQA
jgi:hypothetical protein